MAAYRDPWEPEEEAGTVTEERPRGRKWRVEFWRAAAVTAIVLVAAVAILTAVVINIQNDKAALREQLTEAEKKLELREDAMAALEAQQNEQTTRIQDLQNKIDELLNVEEADPVITSDQLREQLSAVSELVTFKYIYTNAARTEGGKTWLWGWPLPFSSTSLLATYDGTIKAGIDLKDVKIDVNEERRTITVTLPASKVTDNNIPQETINVLEVRNSLFNEVTFDDYNEFIRAEKEVMEQKAIERGILAEADKEAEAVIRAFLALVPGIDTYQLIFQ